MRRQDSARREALIRLWIDAELLRLGSLRAQAKREKGVPGPEGSVLKLLSGRVLSGVSEMVVGLMGADGMLCSPYTRRGRRGRDADPRSGVSFVGSPGGTIAGGTTEIQKNIVGERVLGLPASRASTPTRRGARSRATESTAGVGESGSGTRRRRRPRAPLRWTRSRKRAVRRHDLHVLDVARRRRRRVEQLHDPIVGGVAAATIRVPDDDTVVVTLREVGLADIEDQLDAAAGRARVALESREESRTAAGGSRHQPSAAAPMTLLPSTSNRVRSSSATARTLRPVPILCGPDLGGPMAASFEPAVAGQVAQALGPMFALPITAPEAVDRFAAIGFDRDEWAERYFAFRSAQLGRATAETVIATYFNFAPRRIHRYIPRVWDIADPEVVLDTLMDSVDAAMGRALVDMAGTPELRELANLISAAAASAFEHPEGRPLFAGIAGIPWPEAPHAQVWLGMHALREFRGDGHVAVLTANGLTGLEALVLHAGMGLFPPDLLRSSRAGRRRCGTTPSRSCAAAA